MVIRIAWIICVFSLSMVPYAQGEAAFRSTAALGSDSGASAILGQKLWGLASDVKNPAAKNLVSLYQKVQAPSVWLSFSDESVNRIEFRLEPLKRRGLVQWDIDVVKFGVKLNDLASQGRVSGGHGFVEASLDNQRLTAAVTYFHSSDRMLFSLVRRLGDYVSMRWQAITGPNRVEQTGVLLQFSGPLSFLDRS